MTNDEALDILAAKRSAANAAINGLNEYRSCLLYTSPSPRDS